MHESLNDKKIFDARKLTDQLNQNNLNTAVHKNKFIKSDNLPKDFDNKDKALEHRSRFQDVTLRNKFIKAINDIINSQKHLRVGLSIFYTLYLSVVTVFIFYILKGNYPLVLKKLLIGAFFFNLLSILVIMFKYSFVPIKTIVKLFKSIKK